MSSWFMDEKSGQKALQGDSGIASVSANMPTKVQINNDPVSLMRLYNGFAYACGVKIANFVSTIPIHLYAIVKPGSSKDLVCGHKSLLGHQLKGPMAIPAVKSALIRRQDAEVVELIEHPLLDLIRRPNETMSWPDFIQTVISYFSVIGNCYIRPEIINGKITQLHPLLSEYVWAYTDGDGNIVRYLYAPASQAWISHTYAAKEIIHLMTPSAGSIVGGRGWIEAVQKECRLISEFNDHMIALANNMGQPGSVITITGKAATEKEKQTVVQKFMAQFARLKRGQPFVSYSEGINDKIDIKPAGISPKDLAYFEHMPWLRSAICAAASVPEDLIHSTNSNRSSSQTAMASFLAHTIIPYVHAILERFNHSIVPLYDENLILGYDPAEVLRGDPVILSGVLKTYVLSGLMTQNEARQMMDMPPLDGGDTLVSPDRGTANLRGNERDMAAEG